MLNQNRTKRSSVLRRSVRGVVVGRGVGAGLNPVESLERRQMFATVVGLTSANQLVTFDSATPGTVSAPLAITGLAGGESVLSLDFRPGTSALFALGSTGQVYTLNQATGAATAVGAGISGSITVDATRTAIDFNPSVDRIRVVSVSDQNYRVNPGTGAFVLADTTLTYAAADAGFGVNPNVAAIAYSNNFASTSTTSLYGIDSGRDTLVLQGSLNGTPNSPNGGLLTTVGSLGINTTDLAGFDIAEGDGVAYASLTLDSTNVQTASTLYTINLTTGAATAVGAISAGATLRDLAVVPVQRTLVGLVVGGAQIATFSPSNLSAPITPISLTGLQAGETLVGIDFRPATGVLYGVGSTGRLYTVNTTTGASTQVGTTAFDPALNGTNFGIDFNPTVDRLRLVSDADQNLRINPITGAIVDNDTVTAGTQIDTALVYAVGDANVGANPNVIGAAYTSNLAGATSTSLYGIDSNTNSLVLQGSLAGATTTVSPNTGQLTTVGALGFDLTVGGFDIAAGNGPVAYLAGNVPAVNSTQLYTVQLSTGTTISLGVIGNGLVAFSDIAATLNVLNISAPTLSTGEAGGTANVTVTRTGNTTVASTVNFATANGTATAPNDYVSNTGTLTFAPGETSKVIAVLVVNDTADELDETFTVTLTGPTGDFALGGTSLATVTLVDDDAAPTLSVANVSVAEGNAGTTNLTFIVTLSAASGQTVTVQAASDLTGSATVVTDFTALPLTTLTFAPGVISQTFTVSVNGDLLNEADETVGVVLSNPTNSTILAGAAVGTITNDDAVPTLSVANVSAAEGNVAGTNSLTFTVTLSAASAQTVTVQAASDLTGTATSGVDFTALAPVTLTFAPGETTQTFTVPILGDVVQEGDETVGVVLTNPTNSTLAVGTALGTITDDDAAPTISVASVSTLEGTTGDTNTLVFTVLLSGPSGQTVTVDVATDLTGTATEGTDFTGRTPVTLTFLPGETSRTFSVSVVGDALNETDETVGLVLSNPTNATITVAAATGTITNDDVAPTISVSDTSALEGSVAAPGVLTYTVTLSAASAQTVTVGIATDGTGTATSGTDFTPVSVTTLTFLPGETSQTFTVAIVGDSLAESNETVGVVLSNATNSTILDGAGVGTITDDDTSPTISVSDVTGFEGNAGDTNTLVFAVTLSAASENTITVDVATDLTGTATEGTDFTGRTPFTLTFLPGETSKTFTVSLIGDTVAEANETVGVVLSNPTNSTILDGAGVGTITNDDTNPTLSVSDATVAEGNAGGTSVLTFTVTLSSASGLPVSVQVASNATGTATVGTDFTALALTTLNFAPGETSRTFSVSVIGDTTLEGSETVGVVLSNATNAVIADGAGVGTITNDDGGATLVAEPNVTGRNAVVVTGTPGDDVIVLRKSTARETRGQIEVVLNGAVTGTFPTRNVTRLVVNAGDGSDDVRIDTGLALPSLLLGGAGDDLLIGSRVRDIIIGGAGIDAIYGRAGEDIILGGTTTLDGNSAALASIHQRWIGSGSFATRASVVQSGLGVTGGFAFSATTIQNDASSRDFLGGEGSNDLFFASAGDVISDDTLRGLRINI